MIVLVITCLLLEVLAVVGVGKWHISHVCSHKNETIRWTSFCISLSDSKWAKTSRLVFLLDFKQWTTGLDTVYCGFSSLSVQMQESDSGQARLHVPLILIHLFKPHLEDLTLPLAYTRMSQLSSSPSVLLVLEHSWPDVHLQNWPLHFGCTGMYFSGDRLGFMLSSGPRRGLILLLLSVQQGVRRWIVH